LIQPQLSQLHQLPKLCRDVTCHHRHKELEMIFLMIHLWNYFFPVTTLAALLSSPALRGCCLLSMLMKWLSKDYDHHHHIINNIIKHYKLNTFEIYNSRCQRHLD
jgi:hypothetical protein